MTPTPAEQELPAPRPLAALPDRDLWVRWLASDLLEDSAARLEHAGGGSATTIALAKVFVDVAAGGHTGDTREAAAGGRGPDAARAEHDEEDDSNREVQAPDIETIPPPEPGLLAELLKMAPRAASPAVRTHVEGPSHASSGGKVFGRILVFGGPGQGKSTLVQQLCQLHRAALLAPEREALLPAARNTLDLLLATHAIENLPVPETPCWPIRVILRDFAAWLSRDKGDLPTALLRFMVRRFSDKKSPLTAERFAALLSERPWLLVLDGLDEVPISGGRNPMLEAVRAWVEGPASASPHLIVATTRPQGYAGELGDFDARPLSDLTRSRAFRYASLLAEARHPNQPVRQREVLERLSLAWVEPASRRLLRTPLQVSMMAALVAEVGRVPTDRYRLFSEYHHLMYRRELERPNLAHAELLRDLQKPIDEVHRWAGFWLQVRSEEKSGTEALLSRDELEQLIHLVLERFGYEDASERAQWVERIFEAAIERLVLLVHAEQDRYGFEIRSLQELMAAEALVNGEDHIVKERLRQVAPIDAWRNVVLFAAGKCFAQTDHLGAFIANELCPWLNDGIEEPSVRGVLTGSELALDLLEDGAARRQRQVEKPLVALALRLLELAPNRQHVRLARIGEKEFPEALRQAVERKLAGKEAVSGWVTIRMLANDLWWAADLAMKYPPKDTERLSSGELEPMFAIERLRFKSSSLHSDLRTPATCERLRLPPLPEPPPSADTPSIQQIPWTPITTVTLANLRPFRATVFDFPVPPTSAGQWSVLVGENGVGKSTILRGLALTLADGSAAAGALAKSEAPYRSDLSAPAKIEVRTKDRVFSATIEIDREAGRETLSREPKNGGHRPFVVAYGCHRGSALGDPTRGGSFAAESDIATLFDETRGLAPAEGWLTKLKLGAMEDPEGRRAALYRTVERVLLRLLSIEDLDVQADAVWVRSKATGRARLAALSDGYLTTAGWVVDMIARWIDREQRLGREVADKFNETMEGLVLLDEVDLHLHPRWQRRVIRDLKALFPRLSFVITTHQPLTLLGADPGEIFILRRDASGAIDVQQIDLPKGLRADQVLTGEWFGLSTTLDPDTLSLLDEHRRLLRRGVAEDDPRRRALEADLRARLGGFADTPIERMVREVTAEILDDDASDKRRPEELAEAQARITRVARERLERQKKASRTRA